VPYADPEKRRQYNREYKKRHGRRPKTREEKREYHHRRGKHIVRERRYGVTPEQFNDMMARQSGACAICRRDFVETGPPGNMAPCIDHNHVTNKVRGLLCPLCNRTLGDFVTLTWLLAAVEYMIDSRETYRP